MYLGIKIERDRYEGDPSKWPRSSGRTKATIHYEWTNVFLRNGVAYRTVIEVHHLLHHSRGPPKGPLSSTAPSGLVFTIDYAEALGEAVHEGIEFKGIAYESEAPTLLKQLPNGGVDCQDEKVYWTMPDGRCVSYSLRELSYLRDDDLAPQDSHESYLAVAKELGYDALGKPENDEAFEEYRLDPGTVTERRWELINWQRPENETSPCWWVANASDAKAADEEQQEAPVKLVCRSPQVLRLELKAKRCANSTKLRQEWERRLETNARTADVLENNIHLWHHVGGPSPERLRQPTEGDVVAAQSAVNNLRRFLQRREDSGTADDGLEAYAEEICDAVGKIKVVSWEGIHRERPWAELKNRSEQRLEAIAYIFYHRNV